MLNLELVTYERNVGILVSITSGRVLVRDYVPVFSVLSVNQGMCDYEGIGHYLKQDQRNWCRDC